MAKLNTSVKFGLIILVAIIAAAAGFGYFTQTAKLSDESATTADDKIEQSLLTPQPTDLIIGDMNALVTIVEYSSLSCPHCQAFHENVLPTVEKEFINTGKAKLVVRYFPLNDAAVKAAEIVECAAANGLKREDFLRNFFKMQKEWAFDDNYEKNLKRIAAVGGMDSAAFDSCSADKELETRILTMRLEAAEKLHVGSTPTFFVNGMKYEGEPSIEGFRALINQAGTGKKQ